VVTGANEAAGKRQVIVRLRTRCYRKRFAQGAQVFLLRLRPRLRLAVDRKRGIIHANFDGIAETEERIARESFTALDTFEKKARAKVTQLQVRRYRSIEVGSNVEWCLHVSFSYQRQKKTHP
jgi:hypothetical protein